MSYQYQRTPFPLRQARMYQDCHTWGAKDIGADNIQWGEPVYAVEDGTVVFIYSSSTCFSTITSPTTATPPPSNTPNCFINSVVIRGNDGFFTEYGHVKARTDLALCSTVQAGTWIGNVDNSAFTSAPHVHLARYTPNSAYQCSATDNSFRGNPQGATATCDWTMCDVIDISPPPTNNGWVLQNEKWYYYVNCVLQTGWIQDGPNWYWLDSTGAWTGVLWSGGNFYLFYGDSWWFWNGTSWEPY